MLPHSIRGRLLLWLGLLLVCILSGFGLTAYRLQRLTQLHQIDQELELRVAALNGDVRGRPFDGPPIDRPPFEFDRDHEPRKNEMAPPPDFPPFDHPDDEPRMRPPGPDSKMPRGFPDSFLEKREIRLSARTRQLFDETDANAFYYVVWSRSGSSLIKSSTNAPVNLQRPRSAPPTLATTIHTRLLDTHREAYQFTEIGECILVGRSIVADLTASRRFAGWLVIAGLAVLTLGLGGVWTLATRAIQPVNEISATATRIAAGNLAERINVAETDSELGRLAGVLNSTFARLEAAFAQQKQFTADAAHELRTPLAVLISEAQTTLARERNAAEYRETVEACLDTAQQMRRLTQSLLELARFDAGQEGLARASFDLAERTTACLALIAPLAAQRGIQIHSHLAPATACGDTDRVNQVIVNLLSNAIHFNKEHGEIRVTTGEEHAAVILTIADSGQGITPEDLPHVFERFYRGDKARARVNGRNGLGLAICKAIVEAHGGSIELHSEPGVGTTATVRLPKPEASS